MSRGHPRLTPSPEDSCFCRAAQECPLLWGGDGRGGPREADGEGRAELGAACVPQVLSEDRGQWRFYSNPTSRTPPVGHTMLATLSQLPLLRSPQAPGRTRQPCARRAGQRMQG